MKKADTGSDQRLDLVLRSRSRSAVVVAAGAWAAQLALLVSSDVIDPRQAAVLAGVLAFLLIGVLSIDRRRQRLALAFYAAVAGLGGLGMLAGGRVGAGMAGMVIGCLGACLWLCRRPALCMRDRDWRHHLLGLLTMVVGMFGGAIVLTGPLSLVAGHAAGHLAMVAGMAVGTAAGMTAVDRYDDLRARSKNESTADASLTAVGSTH